LGQPSPRESISYLEIAKRDNVVDGGCLRLRSDLIVAYNQRYLDFLKPTVGFRRKTISGLELRLMPSVQVSSFTDLRKEKWPSAEKRKSSL
jgi:hypothetical protein